MRIILFLSFFLMTSSEEVKSLTIDSVITLSDSCVQIKWTPDTTNTNPVWYLRYGSQCTGVDSIYKQCDFIAGREYSGIAYSYGGEDPWYTFREHLSAGFLVGSHQCHYNNYGDPSSIITGTDCSGFLSFVWNYPRSTTSTFYNSAVFSTIPITEVQPGDALIKATAPCGYHAVLIIENEDPKEVVISEASSVSFGCRERIVDLTTSAWSCYKAIRYSMLVNTLTKKSSVIPQKTITVNINQNKPGVLVIDFALPFRGTICGYQPDGSLLFNKNVDQEVTNVKIETGQIRKNIVIIELKTAIQKQVVMERFNLR
jgi:hypothetical protein